MFLSISAYLCNYHRNPFQNLFMTMQRNLNPWAVSPNRPAPTSLAPCRLLSAFCLCRFASSAHFIWMESTLCGLFWQPHFTSHQVHLCGSISWIMFIYMARPHFIYAFMHWWAFGFFVLFSCWEFLLPFVYEFFGGPCIFASRGCATRSRNVESYGFSRFNCWKTTRLFPKPLCQFTFPPAVRKSFNFTTSSSTLVIICLLDCSHPRGEKRYLLGVLICASLTAHMYHLDGHIPDILKPSLYQGK